MSKGLIVVMCSEYLIGLGAISENDEADSNSMYDTILRGIGFEGFDDYKSTYPKCIINEFNAVKLTYGFPNLSGSSYLVNMTCVSPSYSLRGSTDPNRIPVKKEMARLGEIPFGFMIGRIPTLDEMKEVCDFEDVDKTDIDMWYCDGWIETVTFNYDNT